MASVYLRLRERARNIASCYPPPDFYNDFKEEIALSQHVFANHPLIAEIQELVADHIDDDFGHGMHHAKKVAVDAGALIGIEGPPHGYDHDFIQRRVVVVQCAGLLHDIDRKASNHAARGARFAQHILPRFTLTAEEIDDICMAIRDHEAFQDKITIASPTGRLLSDCLYDADKFRWGPDNFKTTVWSMVSVLNPPLDEFIRRYPGGIRSLTRIRDTFRTQTGMRYGPQFIDLGLAIGEELYQVLLNEFNPPPA
jgi:hypothetical protein